MGIISVNSEHSYEVSIDCDWKSSLIPFLKNRARVAVIIPEPLAAQFEGFPSVESEISIFTIPDGEAAKTESTLHTVWNWLGAAGFTRSDLVVGIGGGTVTDFAGFVAATWLRGWSGLPFQRR